MVTDEQRLFTGYGGTQGMNKHDIACQRSFMVACTIFGDYGIMYYLPEFKSDPPKPSSCINELASYFSLVSG